MTVAQANEKTTDRKNVGIFNQEVKTKSKEFSNQMQKASFKMGSILPENNNYKVNALEKSPSSHIGLTRNSSNFKSALM